MKKLCKITVLVSIVCCCEPIHGREGDEREDTRPLNVLCIDGGGVRGIIPAIIAKGIENEAKAIMKKDCSIGQMFDVVAGTSTGGLLASAFAFQGEEFSAADQFSTSKLVEFYKTNSKKIFKKNSWFYRWRGGETYSNQELWSLLQSEFKDTQSNTPEVMERSKYSQDLTLGQSKRRVMITATDANTKELCVFDSDINKEASVCNVCLASAAAPTYFPPVEIGERVYVDGGMMANNPALEVFSRLRKEFPNRTINLISLGTGTHVNSVDDTKSIKKRGLISWIGPSMDMLFAAQSNSTHNVLDRLSRSSNLYYWRIQTSLDHNQLAMDRTDTHHVGTVLPNAAIRTVQGLRETLGEIVLRLCQSKGLINSSVRRPLESSTKSIVREASHQSESQASQIANHDHIPKALPKIKITGVKNADKIGPEGVVSINNTQALAARSVDAEITAVDTVRGEMGGKVQIN